MPVLRVYSDPVSRWIASSGFKEKIPHNMDDFMRKVSQCINEQ
nr:MAG TPA: hypothetical protein [Caudoviricetes sp.]